MSPYRPVTVPLGPGLSRALPYPFSFLLDHPVGITLALSLLLLLLRCGDVESNPGPPRRQPAAPKKEEPKKELSDSDKVGKLEETIKDYEGKVQKLEQEVQGQRKEIDSLKAIVKNLEAAVSGTKTGVDDKLAHMHAKMEAITGVYDDLHEKMHELDKTRKNNLLFYGIKPDFLPEIQSQLEQKIHEIMKFNLHISRDVPVTKISRMISGPEVRGCRPVLVNFVHWKDREEVLRKGNLLRGTNIYITEDLSRKMREHRAELQKYARQIRSKSPQKRVSLRQDKLFIDNHMYVFDDDRNEVIPFTRPPSPPRVPSRNYTVVDSVLRRSASVHSVNGEAERPMTAGGDVVSGPINGKYASTESLHVQQQQHNDHHQQGVPPQSPMPILTSPEPIKEEECEQQHQAQLQQPVSPHEKKVTIKEQSPPPSAASPVVVAAE